MNIELWWSFWNWFTAIKGTARFTCQINRIGGRHLFIAMSISRSNFLTFINNFYTITLSIFMLLHNLFVQILKPDRLINNERWIQRMCPINRPIIDLVGIFGSMHFLNNIAYRNINLSLHLFFRRYYNNINSNPHNILIQICSLYLW